MAPPTIVIGLGNPGRRYDGTRHNVGFDVVARVAAAAGVAFVRGPLADVAEIPRFAGTERDVVLARPRTFMNRSGAAAAELVARYRSTPAQMLLVYDDADLALGRLRIRPGGSAGGHRGVRSVMEALAGVDVPRLKLGVRGEGRGGRELADYVLEPFGEAERSRVREMVDLAAEAVSMVHREGIVKSMNEFNGRLAGGASDIEEDRD